ncbi:hypothetical protein ACP70R_020728 [Stipagrostis hirtigluma subsp. patula]
MEVAISAVTGELVSRFISLLMGKYSERATMEKKVDRLQQLLLRLHTVVEEADGRYIANGGMVMQLKMIANTMYQGYQVLETFKCRQLIKQDSAEREVSDSSAMSLATRLKRPRASRTMSMNDELQSALENLEGVIANMAEFVILMAGCDRMSRRPYDTYLYHDNFMFSRHAEKQQLTSILLQHNPPGPQLVLPIIGGRVVGKKTLVAHVCSDERVRSYFSLILHLDGTNFLRIHDRERLMLGRSLVVVEFVSDVEDTDWDKFYSSVASMGAGSKVILISRHDKIARFGTMRPIHLKRLSDDELSYLFKTLAFGSANPMDHPRLVSILKEFEPIVGGSVVGAYTVADVLRKNVNLKFWVHIMEMCKNMVQRNLDLHGEHPKTLFGRNHPVEIPFVAASAALQLLPCGYATGVSEGDLPQVRFGDLLVDPKVRPKGDFKLVMWASRMPPYNKSVHFVPACDVGMASETSLSGRKRRGHAVM